ncbi:MAG: hypothetical protein KKB21_05395 [Nanoarchaeota archaeon]|nr:hypothetical protein [Nanoarchaeota archaeon]MBU4086981.1 hypothetical protein [Nanoarchaeota archaeon]
MKKKDKFEEFACDFKNEEECREEIDAEGLSKDEVEREHFEESEDARSGVIE